MTGKISLTSADAMLLRTSYRDLVSKGHNKVAEAVKNLSFAQEKILASAIHSKGFDTHLVDASHYDSDVAERTIQEIGKIINIFKEAGGATEPKTRSFIDTLIAGVKTAIHFLFVDTGHGIAKVSLTDIIANREAKLEQLTTRINILQQQIATNGPAAKDIKTAKEQLKNAIEQRDIIETDLAAIKKYATDNKLLGNVNEIGADFENADIHFEAEDQPKWFAPVKEGIVASIDDNVISKTGNNSEVIGLNWEIDLLENEMNALNLELYSRSTSMNDFVGEARTSKLLKLADLEKTLATLKARRSEINPSREERKSHLEREIERLEKIVTTTNWINNPERNTPGAYTKYMNELEVAKRELLNTI